MCFFSPNTDVSAPLRSHATRDRAQDHLANGTLAALRDDLVSLLGPSAVRVRVIDLVKYVPTGLSPILMVIGRSFAGSCKSQSGPCIQSFRFEPWAARGRSLWQKARHPSQRRFIAYLA